MQQCKTRFPRQTRLLALKRITYKDVKGLESETNVQLTLILFTQGDDNDNAESETIVLVLVLQW